MGSQLSLNSSVSHYYSMKFLVFAACVCVSSSLHLVGLPNGAVVPADTPAVAAARAAHAQAGGAVLYHAAPLAAHVVPLVTHFNGAVVPADTPAVAAARAAHAAAGAVHAVQ